MGSSAKRKKEKAKDFQACHTVRPELAHPTNTHHRK